MTTHAFTLGSRIQRIAEQKQVIGRLVGGYLKIKYEGAVLGYLWSVMEPLLLTFIYFFVFSVVFDVSRVPAYPLFLISGILPWQWVAQSIAATARSIRENGALITRVHVSREIFPIAAVASKTAEFFASLLVLALFAGLYRTGPSAYLLLFPLAVLMQATLLTGLGFILAAANTLLRDVERLIGPVVRALFYLTPVLYPVSLVMNSELPRAFKVLYRVNPLVGIFNLYHAAWYPDLFTGWLDVGIAGAGSLLILVFGWNLFRRLEPVVLKEL